MTAVIRNAVAAVAALYLAGVGILAAYHALRLFAQALESSDIVLYHTILAAASVCFLAMWAKDTL